MQSVQTFQEECGDDYNADYDKGSINQDENTELDGWTVIEYTVPERALSYLINGDSSGFEDSEQEAIDYFIKSKDLNEAKGHWSHDSENNEAYFSWRNDITNLGGNCVDIQWVQRIE
jgi:hypothetical protein